MSSTRTRCYVGHLKEGQVSNQDMEELFKKYGTIVDIRVKSNYGFVQFEKEEMADAAVNELNGKEFMGDSIIVQHVHDGSKTPRRGRSSGHPSYYGYYSRGGSRAPYYSNYYDPYCNYYYQYSAQPAMPQNYSGSYDYLGTGRYSAPRGHVEKLPRSRSPRSRRPRSTSPSLANVSGSHRSEWRILVENLSPDVTWQSLREHFLEIGDIRYVSVSSAGTGYVEFEKKEMVAEAVSKLGDTLLKDTKIRVTNIIPLDAKDNHENSAAACSPKYSEGNFSDHELPNLLEFDGPDTIECSKNGKANDCADKKEEPNGKGDISNEKYGVAIGSDVATAKEISTGDIEKPEEKSEEHRKAAEENPVITNKESGTDNVKSSAIHLN